MHIQTYSGDGDISVLRIHNYLYVSRINVKGIERWEFIFHLRFAKNAL